MKRQIRSTAGANLGTFIGSGEREHLVFEAGAVTEVEQEKLAEARRDPIVNGWFEEGLLIDQTNDAKAAPKAEEPKPAKTETKSESKTESKKDDAKK